MWTSHWIWFLSGRILHVSLVTGPAYTTYTANKIFYLKLLHLANTFQLTLILVQDQVYGHLHQLSSKEASAQVLLVFLNFKVCLASSPWSLGRGRKLKGDDLSNVSASDILRALMPVGKMQIHTSPDYILSLKIQFSSLLKEFPSFQYYFLFKGMQYYKWPKAPLA